MRTEKTQGIEGKWRVGGVVAALCCSRPGAGEQYCIRQAGGRRIGFVPAYGAVRQHAGELVRQHRRPPSQVASARPASKRHGRRRVHKQRNAECTNAEGRLTGR
jgi:hypothetical protein